MTWGYSGDGEQYECPYSSREDAIGAARGDLDLADLGFWVAEGIRPNPEEFMPDAEWIVQEMDERASDSEGGLWTDDWPSPSQGHKDKLNALLLEWVKGCPVTWWLFGELGKPEWVEMVRGET